MSAGDRKIAPGFNPSWYEGLGRWFEEDRKAAVQYGAGGALSTRGSGVWEARTRRAKMRKLPRKVLLAAGAAGLMAAGFTATPAMSHHSFAMYTDAYTFAFVGVVINVNPDNN